MTEWDFAESGHLVASSDFHDFDAFRELVKMVSAETLNIRESATPVQIDDLEMDDYRTTATSIQKLIMTNPQFLPRDDFYSVFVELKSMSLKQNFVQKIFWFTIFNTL